MKILSTIQKREKLNIVSSVDENENALTHIEEALMWLNRRIEDRIERNILGTNNK